MWRLGGAFNYWMRQARDCAVRNGNNSPLVGAGLVLMFDFPWASPASRELSTPWCEAVTPKRGRGPL